MAARIPEPHDRVCQASYVFNREKRIDRGHDRESSRDPAGREIPETCRTTGTAENALSSDRLSKVCFRLCCMRPIGTRAIHLNLCQYSKCNVSDQMLRNGQLTRRQGMSTTSTPRRLHTRECGDAHRASPLAMQ